MGKSGVCSLPSSIAAVLWQDSYAQIFMWQVSYAQFSVWRFCMATELCSIFCLALRPNTQVATPVHANASTTESFSRLRLNIPTVDA